MKNQFSLDRKVYPHDLVRSVRILGYDWSIWFVPRFWFVPRCQQYIRRSFRRINRKLENYAQEITENGNQH